MLWWVWRDPRTPPLEVGLVKPLIKSLLDNTKDKNTSVRAQSEHTIVNLLRLRQGEDIMQVRTRSQTRMSHRTLFIYCFLVVFFRAFSPFWTP